MCIAIMTKPGAVVPPDRLWAGWLNNKDGGGFAYIDPKTKKVVVKSGFMSYNDFQKAYAEAAAEYGREHAMLVHMRIRTSGNISRKNCHPFKIKGGALIHNGSMFNPTGDLAGPKDDQWSDTRVFAHYFHNQLGNLDHVKRAEKDLLWAIGSHNKLCFLMDGGEYFILNEKLGNWLDDVWYSNGTAVPRNYHDNHRGHYGNDRG